MPYQTEKIGGADWRFELQGGAIVGYEGPLRPCSHGKPDTWRSVVASADGQRVYGICGICQERVSVHADAAALPI